MQEELTCTTPLVPRESAAVIFDPVPTPVVSIIPVAVYLNVLAVLVAMEVMVMPSVRAEETTVPDTTWYLRRLTSTACRETESVSAGLHPKLQNM